MDGLSSAFRAFFTQHTQATALDASLLLLGTAAVLVLAAAIIARQLSSL
jgi:hypothetical protein